MAAAAILVCRLSQSVLVHVTLMPVDLVNASRSAWGGGAVARATVIVTPVVFLEAAHLRSRSSRWRRAPTTLITEVLRPAER